MAVLKQWWRRYKYRNAAQLDARQFPLLQLKTLFQPFSTALLQDPPQFN